ncbi:Predicted kinase, aminoglycoside phosphotransferase (APT) family [Streptomyces sp. WMMB 714]|uniref:phosphotransferase family protein n=1 Tax=Streptomyces sp. WMMB 714 TaxID=1286822 RepID=UPI000823910E|nr:aminoglycoside phosphotransferase family protein [Streptomyces sp. WMMB 714]SCK40210.1 Predicted kinase, aminoglycoside phosphotransferase (APT) family [Streptomyces sp. WMMB 714]
MVRTPGGADRAELEEAARFLRGAGVDPDGVVSLEPMTGGSYNTLHRVRTTDGTCLVLKTAPPECGPRLRYEQRLLEGEAAYYRAAARCGGVPVPRVVHSGTDGATAPDGAARAALLMTQRPGTAWSEVSGGLTGGERSALRRSLGGMIARVHTVRGPRFGYPAQPPPAGLPPAGWRDVFTAMLRALLEDAERYAAPLPLPVPALRTCLDRALPALEHVHRPVPVHFDLWEGNVLLDGARGSRHVSGIVDGERMFWGDPLADFPSLQLFGRAENDPDLMAGYRAAAGGGPDLGDEAVLTRLALYRCYLYLIMLVETVPRAPGAEAVRWTRAHAGPALLEALDALGPGTGPAAGTPAPQPPVRHPSPDRGPTPEDGVRPGNPGPHRPR